jgi:hypothetical protein
MMILETRKTVTNIAHACFFLEKHIASFERFLSDNIGDMNQVAKTLVHLLLEALNERLLIGSPSWRTAYVYRHDIQR